MIKLKYLSNFWRTIEMPLINCETNLFLTLSTERIIVIGTVNNQEPRFAISDTKLYVPIVTLSAIMQNCWSNQKSFRSKQLTDINMIRTNITDTYSIFKSLNRSKFLEGK